MTTTTNPPTEPESPNSTQDGRLPLHTPITLPDGTHGKIIRRSKLRPAFKLNQQNGTTSLHPSQVYDALVLTEAGEKIHLERIILPEPQTEVLL